jgi:hypothetical protein
MSSDTQLLPAWVPPPLNEPCGCASDKNLCGVLIFPKEPKPSDGVVEESSSEPDDISIQVAFPLLFPSRINVDSVG